MAPKQERCGSPAARGVRRAGAPCAPQAPAVPPRRLPQQQCSLAGPSGLGSAGKFAPVLQYNTSVRLGAEKARGSVPISHSRAATASRDKKRRTVTNEGAGEEGKPFGLYLIRDATENKPFSRELVLRGYQVPGAFPGARLHAGPACANRKMSWRQPGSGGCQGPGLPGRLFRKEALFIPFYF